MHSNNLPLYQSIANDLKKKILEEKDGRGAALPSEKSLCATYHVSRVTIRKALDELVHQKLIYKVPGSGSFSNVGNLSHSLEKSDHIFSFSEEMRHAGITPSSEIVFFHVIPATREIAEKIKIRIGTPIYYYQRNRLGNDDIYFIETTYMQVALFPDFSMQHLAASKFAYVEEHCKKKIVFSHQRIEPRLATQRESNLFKINKDSPLLRIHHTTYLDDASVMDYTIMDINPRVYEIHYTKKRPITLDPNASFNSLLP